MKANRYRLDTLVTTAKRDKIKNKTVSDKVPFYANIKRKGKKKPK